MRLKLYLSCSRCVYIYKHTHDVAALFLRLLFPRIIFQGIHTNTPLKVRYIYSSARQVVRDKQFSNFPERGFAYTLTYTQLSWMCTYESNIIIAFCRLMRARAIARCKMKVKFRSGFYSACRDNYCFTRNV